MDLKFRTLHADEIDCRVASINEKGLSLLLYKDARVDMMILDETVGPMNWQRRHTRENANCIVALWDEEKKQWIEKEDVGTESQTEAQKGLASDSFKRACFNWGIGRELYTAPFIWIKADQCNIFKNDKGKYACFDPFYVASIRIEGGKITSLAIGNQKRNEIVFTYGSLAPEKAHQNEKPAAPAKVSSVVVKELEMLAQKAGVTVEQMLQQAKVASLEDMTPKSAEQMKKALKATITRKAREANGTERETA